MDSPACLSQAKRHTVCHPTSRRMAHSSYRSRVSTARGFFLVLAVVQHLLLNIIFHRPLMIVSIRVCGVRFRTILSEEGLHALGQLYSTVQSSSFLIVTGL